MPLLPFIACAITTAQPTHPIPKQNLILFLFTDVAGSGGYANLKTSGNQSTGGRLYWIGSRWNVSALHPATGQSGHFALPVRAMPGTL